MDRWFNYIAGFASLFGFAASIVPLVYFWATLTPIKGAEQFYSHFKEIYFILAVSIFLLITCFLLLVAHYSVRLAVLTERLGVLPIENENLRNKLARSILSNESASECIHNIAHYYRNVLHGLTYIAGKVQTNDSSNEQIARTLGEFDRFLLLMLSNVCAYFEKKTLDKCAVSIKIVNNEMVRTFFRDPVSHRLRKQSDYNQDGTHFIYRLSDNYAFRAISSPDIKQTTFVSDDLINFPDYYNRNPNWSKFYRATAVVPIQCRVLVPEYNPKEVEMLGFLCVDNLLGGFENRETVDYLAAIADLFFCMLVQYDKVALAAVERGVKNERAKIYTNWGDSK